MRGLVLFLLGGAVLFLAWSGYGRNPESPAPEVSERPSRGRMMSVSEMEAALQEVARGDGALPPQGQGERAISSANRALGYENGKNEAPGADLTSEAGPLALDWNLGDPVLEGSMLLHDLERMEEYLGDGAGKDLSKGRKHLLFVLAVQFQMLDAGQLIFHRFRDAGHLKADR